MPDAVELGFALGFERAGGFVREAAAFDGAGVDAENAGDFGGAEGIFDGQLGEVGKACHDYRMAQVSAYVKTFV